MKLVSHRIWYEVTKHNFLEGKSDFRWGYCGSALGYMKGVTLCWNEVVVVKDLINGRKHTCPYFKI